MGESASPSPSCALCRLSLSASSTSPSSAFFGLLTSRTTASDTLLALKVFEATGAEALEGYACQGCHDLLEQIDLFEQNALATKRRLRERMMATDREEMELAEERHKKGKKRGWHRKKKVEVKEEEADEEMEEGAVGKQNIEGETLTEDAMQEKKIKDERESSAAHLEQKEEVEKPKHLAQGEEEEEEAGGGQKRSKVEEALCDLCPKSFRGPRLLSKHLFAIHGLEQRTPCRHCGLVFPSYSEFRLHNAAAHERKRATCHRCGRQFQTGEACRLHMENKHGAGAERVREEGRWVLLA